MRARRALSDGTVELHVDPAPLDDDPEHAALARRAAWIEGRYRFGPACADGS